MISWHRFYDPSTGRYISADPIGLAGGMNLYAYVGGNPINRFDLEGLKYEPDIFSDPSYDNIRGLLDTFGKFQQYVGGVTGCGNFLLGCPPDPDDCQNCCQAIAVTLPTTYKQSIIAECILACNNDEAIGNLQKSLRAFIPSQ